MEGKVSGVRACSRGHLAALVAVLLVLSSAVAGCGSSSKSGNGGGAASSGSGAKTATSGAAAGGSSAGIDIGGATVKPNGKKAIAFLGAGTTSYTYTQAQLKAAKQAGAEAGYRVDTYFDNLNPQTELQNFQTAISSGKYGGIVIHPVNTQLCKAVKTDSVKYHVLVGVVGNAMCDTGGGVGNALWAPGTVFYVGGANDVTTVESVLDAAAKANPGPQHVALVLGAQGEPSSNSWIDEWKHWSSGHPSWKLDATVYTDLTTPGAFQATQNLLQSHSNITMIFTQYVDIAVGITKAVSAAGDTGKVKVYENGGGSTVAKQLVQEGKLTGDLPVLPEDNGRVGVQQMIEALQGKQPPRFTGGDGDPNFSATGVITKANVASFEPQW